MRVLAALRSVSGFTDCLKEQPCASWARRSAAWGRLCAAMSWARMWLMRVICSSLWAMRSEVSQASRASRERSNLAMISVVRMWPSRRWRKISASGSDAGTE
jgi:hypothetical protein